jgi:hypothetical protein
VLFLLGRLYQVGKEGVRSIAHVYSFEIKAVVQTMVKRDLMEPAPKGKEKYFRVSKKRIDLD